MYFPRTTFLRRLPQVPAWALMLFAFLAFSLAHCRSLAEQTVDTDPLNRDPEVREAFQSFYIMDYPSALARFEKVRAAHPDDPIATDYILYVTLFRELF